MGISVSVPCIADTKSDNGAPPDIVTRYLSSQVVQPLNSAYSSLQVIQGGLDAIFMAKGITIQNKTGYGDEDCVDESPEEGLARLLLDSKASCLDAMNIIESVTMYDRLIRSLTILSPRLFGIKEVINECIFLNLKQTTSKGVDVIFISDGINDIEVKADRHQTLRMLGSLIRMGAKVSNYGDSIEVKFVHILSMDIPWENTTVSPPDAENSLIDGFIRISVKDKGFGLTSAQIENLKQHFIEFSSPEHHDGQGYSLDIWVANKIATMHGGKIGIYSDGSHKGTVFYIDLPIQCTYVPVSRPISGPNSLRSTR